MMTKSGRGCWRAMAVCALSVGGLLLPGGCNDDPPVVSDEAPYHDVQIAVSVPPATGFQAAWELPVTEWSEATGAQVALRGVATNTPIGEWTKNTNLVLFPIPDFAELAEEGALGKIPEDRLTDTLAWNEVFQGLRENVCSWRQRPTIVPLQCPVLVCYYRRDLLEVAGLRHPRTWEDYQNLLETLESWAPGLTAVEPWSPEFRATLFLARAVSFARHPGHYSTFFDIETGAPLIASPGFVRAAEWSLRALPKLSPKVLGYSPFDCRQEILSGRAALALAYETGPSLQPLPAIAWGTGVPPLSGGTSATTDAATGTVALRRAHRPKEVMIGFCPLPGALEVYNPTRKEWEPAPKGEPHFVGLTGFAGLAAAVTTSSDKMQTEAAWNLLGRLLGPDLASGAPAGTTSPTREGQLGETARWGGDDLPLREIRDYLNAVAVTLRGRQLVAELPVVGRNRFRSTLGDGLAELLNKSESPEAALEGVARHWEQIIKEIGIDRVRDSYRGSLGLLPHQPLPQP